LISRRTKDALAAAKAGIANQRAVADFAEQLRPVFEEISYLSARQVAAKLNERGIKSFAGGQWHASQVIRVRERLKLQ
jgi:Recombinase